MDFVHVLATMPYTHSTCIMGTVHVLWPEYMYYGQSTCIMAAVYVLWP